MCTDMWYGYSEVTILHTHRASEWGAQCASAAVNTNHTSRPLVHSLAALVLAHAVAHAAV